MTRRLPGTLRGYRVPVAHPGNRAIRDVLVELYGREPYVMRTGASLPVAELFLQTLGAYTVVMGFSQEDEQVHAPNEFLRLDSYVRAKVGHCMLLERLAR